jgi:fructoselysine-6-P-deglycase FrlB-like protein
MPSHRIRHPPSPSTSPSPSPSPSPFPPHPLPSPPIHLLAQAARAYRYASNFLYLGRGFNFPVALEGALKLKEISYIHAEGYPAAEMKHGPIALIDQFMPVVIIAPRSDPNYLKLLSNIEEVLARGGSVIAITEVSSYYPLAHRGLARPPAAARPPVAWLAYPWRGLACPPVAWRDTG